MVVVSLFLLLFMARQRLAERTQLSLPTALGAVSRENRLGCLPRQGLAKRKARKGAQRQDDTHAPVREDSNLLYINGVLRGRSP